MESLILYLVLLHLSVSRWLRLRPRSAKLENWNWSLERIMVRRSNPILNPEPQRRWKRTVYELLTDYILLSYNSTLKSLTELPLASIIKWCKIFAAKNTTQKADPTTGYVRTLGSRLGPQTVSVLQFWTVQKRPTLGIDSDPRPKTVPYVLSK